jgi:hypothetical protein
MHTNSSPLSPALLTLWATNHGTLRRVQNKKDGLSGWQLDEHCNALSQSQRVYWKLKLGGTKPYVLWQLWMDNWLSKFPKFECR